MRNISIPNTPVNNIWKNLPENLKRRIIQNNVPKARRLPKNMKRLIEDPLYRYFNKLVSGANRKLQKIRYAPGAKNANARNVVYVNTSGLGRKFELPKDIRKWSKLEDPKYRKKVASHHIRRRIDKFAMGQPVTANILKEIINENIFGNLRGVTNNNAFVVRRNNLKKY